MYQSDILVIGSGVAGLSFAIKMAELHPDASITILTKGKKEECNTSWAQGGIAAVTDFEIDSFEKHIDDTLIAGDGLCKRDIVEVVVKEGRARVDEIIDWGASFDKESNGKYDLGKEGGHSENRILHYKDVTGWEIERTLLEKIKTFSNIKVLEHYYVVDLITQHHLGRVVTRLTPNVTCYGVYVLNLETKDMERHLSKVVLLATGGTGQVYRNTTNPTVATGDGIAMAYRAKCRIENMEFVQFHPTALFHPGETPNFLVSEAVRGEGAILRNHSGEAFMVRYDERKDLAPRDIVARAIDNEMKLSGEEHMWLDCTHMDMQEFEHHFPNILEKCESIGLDLTKDYIPVVPAAHYMCGGIKTDEWGCTSIQHLYSAGESASTGLHGANRLASNSLLQGLVFGQRAAIHAANALKSISFVDNVPEWDAEGTTNPKEMVLITQSHKELKDLMGTYVGIVRTNKRLKRAMDRLYLLYKETENLYASTTLSPQLLELRNVITVGYLITRSAAFRKESRGLHYNTDYPEKQAWIEDTLA
ncbi:MAG: L-aspartate oxidase [Saprospiraceae bacterium]|nr:L-aspartate oxidase [Saprospiraceae bacterium]